MSETEERPTPGRPDPTHVDPVSASIDPEPASTEEEANAELDPDRRWLHKRLADVRAARERQAVDKARQARDTPQAQRFRRMETARLDAIEEEARAELAALDERDALFRLVTGKTTEERGVSWQDSVRQKADGTWITGCDTCSAEVTEDNATQSADGQRVYCGDACRDKAADRRRERGY